MTIRSITVAGLALIAAVVITVRNDSRALAAAPPQSASPADHPPRDCSGEPCDAVTRGFLTFLDRRLAGLGGNGRSCADCHMPTSQFQLAPADVEFRYRLLQLERLFNRNADDPLFRPIDADDFRVNGDQARDFSNLRSNGLIRIVFPLPPNIRLIDPATNLPSAEAIVDVWRSVPSVLNVALTGPGNANPWPREPNAFGGYQLDARVGTLQEQAFGAFVNHAQVQQPPTQRMLDDLSSFQRNLFTRTAGQRPRGGHPHGSVGPARSGPTTDRSRTTGQGGVRTRLRPVPRRPRSVIGAASGSTFSGHPNAVPASGRHRHAAAIRFPGLSGSVGAKCADVRNLNARRDHNPPHEFRSWASIADGRRRWACAL